MPTSWSNASASGRAEQSRTIDYADPTGNRAIKPDQASRDLVELDRRLRNARADVTVMLSIFQRHQAARTPAQIEDIRTVAERELDALGDDWCKSHLRVGVLEPVTINKRDGSPYYRDQCKSCGDLLGKLKAEHPKRFRTYRLAPVELVTIRTYRKLRQADIDALVGPQHKPSKKRKHAPREDHQQSSARRGA